MTDELPVHINREGVRELEVPDTIEATDSFDVRFVNHGEALHVHLNTGDGLSRVVTVDAGNRHVPGNGERRGGGEVGIHRPQRGGAVRSPHMSERQGAGHKHSKI